MARPSPQKRLIARLLLLAALFAVVWYVRHRQQSDIAKQPTAPTANEHQNPTRPNAQTPTYVIDVLRFVRQNGRAPEGYVGGREFQNREKRLPAKSPDGQRLRYSEWDVHPKIEGQNRGPERLVTGSDHSAWYTKDHYKSFLKIE
jgi:guanyl-specific ribonuclease Sa